MTFNLAQRAHKNTLEALTPVICFLLIAGLRYVWIAVAFGCVYFFGRVIFAVGYSKSAELRVPGVVISSLSTFGLLLTSI